MSHIEIYRPYETYHLWVQTSQAPRKLFANLSCFMHGFVNMTNIRQPIRFSLPTSRHFPAGILRVNTPTGAWLMHNQSCVQMQPTAMWKGSLSRYMKVFSRSVCHNTPNHCCQENNSLFLPCLWGPFEQTLETSCTGYLVVGIIKEPFDMKNVHFCGRMQTLVRTVKAVTETCGLIHKTESWLYCVLLGDNKGWRWHLMWIVGPLVSMIILWRID